METAEPGVSVGVAVVGLGGIRGGVGVAAGSNSIAGGLKLTRNDENCGGTVAAILRHFPRRFRRNFLQHSRHVPIRQIYVKI